METSKGVKPEKAKRRSTWLIAGALMVASAGVGWWLAGPTSGDDDAQILATAPPADTPQSNGSSAAVTP